MTHQHLLTFLKVFWTSVDYIGGLGSAPGIEREWICALENGLDRVRSGRTHRKTNSATVYQLQRSEIQGIVI